MTLQIVTIAPKYDITTRQSEDLPRIIRENNQLLIADLECGGARPCRGLEDQYQAVADARERAEHQVPRGSSAAASRWVVAITIGVTILAAALLSVAV